MQPVAMALATIVLALLAPSALALVIKDEPEKLMDPEAIHEKWDKMDDFLEAMFVMACQAKHGKDVAGSAAEKLAEGEVEGAAGYIGAVKDTQAANVEGLERACGMITADGKKKCRMGCATQWDGMKDKRQECDDNCVTAYKKFDNSCVSKAEDLEKVYDLKNKKAEGQKQCYEGFCSGFPMVWMKAEAEDMHSEIDKQCAVRCAVDNVKATCMKSWVEEEKSVTAEAESRCAEDSEMNKCFEAKKADASTKFDDCHMGAQAVCDEDYEECHDKGKVDESPKDAEQFCVERRKMCHGQANDKCLAENKADLDAAVSSCKKEAGGEFDTCKEAAIKEAKDNHDESCMEEATLKCNDDCQGSCQVEKMRSCLNEFGKNGNPGKMFCKDFWNLLHTSSEVDPVTGAPIVLLSRKSSLSPVI